MNIKCINSFYCVNNYVITVNFSLYLDYFTLKCYNCFASEFEEKGGDMLENREILSKNLKKFMSLYDKSRNQLCDDLNLKYSTVSDWINANTYPRIDNIELLANYFNIEKSDLIENKSPQKSVERMPSEWVRIPVLGEIAAGVPIDAIEIFDEGDWEEIPLEWLKNDDEFFALRIKGDSMMPHIHNKDVVIVKKQSCIEDGEIAVILVNGEEATTKKIKKNEKGVFLIPNNPAYTPKFYSNADIEELPITILGKVVELRRKF